MSNKLVKVTINALEQMKAKDIEVLDVHDKCSFTDTMIIVTGTSNRHVKALANEVVIKSKANGVIPLGVEGVEAGEWVLVDLADAVIHIMLPKIREFYQLEKLWSVESLEADV